MIILIRNWRWLLAGTALLAVALASYFRPFSDEPVYHGHTVTEWLDRMALFDGLRQLDNGEDSYELPKAPAAVQSDPSLRAILAIGPKAMPILERVLNQAPRKASRKQDNVVDIVKSKLMPSSYAPPIRIFSGAQLAQMSAASLAWLALGTNQQAGALRLIELAAANTNQDFVGRRSEACLDGFSVARGLTQQHDEIVSGILAGLAHTNPICQLEAIQATRKLRDDVSRWKSPLLKLASSSDPTLCQTALWTLACLDAKDDQTIALCEAALRNTNNPPHLRASAAAGLGMAGRNSTNALPLLQQVLAEKGIPKGSGLSGESRRAIDAIQKASANQ